MAEWYKCELCKSDLDGMQPTLRHVPPSVSFFSTQAVYNQARNVVNNSIGNRVWNNNNNQNNIYFESELSGLDGGNVAARSGADDGQVELVAWVCRVALRDTRIGSAHDSYFRRVVNLFCCVVVYAVIVITSSFKSASRLGILFATLPWKRQCRTFVAFCFGSLVLFSNQIESQINQLVQTWRRWAFRTRLLSK